MKGIKFSQAIVAMFVMVLATTSAWAAYDVGFTWNIFDDWTPGTTDGSSAGNPMPDAAGNPTWSCEYIAGVPAGSGLDSNNPWYELPSSGLMVWDSHYGAGQWMLPNDTPPSNSYTGMWHVCNDQSYGGDHYANVPLRRWQNPSDETLAVSLSGGPDFAGVIHALPTGTILDLVIARTDASNGDSVHLLYSETVVKTASEGEDQSFPLTGLDIDNLVLDPGDDIIFTARSRTRITGYAWASAGLVDDVNITVVPEPATLSMLALGGLAMLRRRRASR